MREYGTERIRSTLSRRQAVLGAGALAASGGLTTTHAQSATPATPGSSPASDVATLQSMLAQIPAAVMPENSDPAVLFFWADIAIQFAVAGVERYFPYLDQTDPGPYQRLMQPLATASPLFNFVSDKELATALGFRADAVDQSLLLGNSNGVNVFRGGMTADELTAAWKRSGYTQEMVGDGATVWSLGDEFVSNSVIAERLATAFNNATILPGGDVVFTATLDLMTSIVTFQSDKDSVADDPSLAPLLAAMPNQTASVIATNSAFLRPRQDKRGGTIQSRLNSGSKDRRPPENEGSFAIGITAGFMDAKSYAGDSGTPQAEQLAVIPDGGAISARQGIASAEQAQLAVDIITERWETGTSLATGLKYAEILEIIGAGVTETVVGIDFLPLRNPSNWIDLVLQQDLLPFGPIDD